MTTGSTVSSSSAKPLGGLIGQCQFQITGRQFDNEQWIVINNNNLVIVVVSVVVVVFVFFMFPNTP
jgi:hypothetical protein